MNELSRDNPNLTKEQVFAETDEAVLQGWWADAQTRAADIMAQIDNHNDCRLPLDDSWFIRACGARRSMKMIATWARRRMLDLGYSSKRPGSDPMVQRVVELEAALSRAWYALKGANEGDPLLLDITAILSRKPQ